MTEGASTARSELWRTEQEKTREEVARHSPGSPPPKKKQKNLFLIFCVNILFFLRENLNELSQCDAEEVTAGLSSEAKEAVLPRDLRRLPEDSDLHQEVPTEVTDRSCTRRYRMSRGEDGGRTKTTKQKLASPVPGETTKGPETTELAETEKAMTKYEAWSSVTPNLTRIPPKRDKATRGLRLALSESTKTMKELDTEPAETMGPELIGLGLTLSESQTKTKMALSESPKTRVALSESLDEDGDEEAFDTIGEPKDDGGGVEFDKSESEGAGHGASNKDGVGPELLHLSEA
jgi:hypothetical protein